MSWEKSHTSYSWSYAVCIFIIYIFTFKSQISHINNKILLSIRNNNSHTNNDDNFILISIYDRVFVPGFDVYDNF